MSRLALPGMSRSASTVRPHPHRVLLVAFFVSGAAGLVHEVAWTRLLRHVMGNSTFAVTTVLAVFLGGLALGSRLAGGWIRSRRDPLRVFALLEVAVGLLGLAVPLLVGALEPVYGALHRASSGTGPGLALARALVASVALLPAATAMGATLPVLVRAVDRGRGEGVGGVIARLYALNTLGAVVGVLAAGFVLLPGLGLGSTIHVACALNLLVGAVAYGLHRLSGEQAADGLSGLDGLDGNPQERPRRPLPGERIVLSFYALAGACTLAYEVAWTRQLGATIGSSVYAFTMILAAFVLGIGLGSLFVTRLVDRLSAPLGIAARVQLGVGLGSLAVVPLLGELPLLSYRWILRFGESFYLLQLVQFALVLSVTLLPTLAVGATFPLVARHLASGDPSAARATGRAYAFGTVGSIFGALAAGFWLLPTVGVQWTLFLAAIGNGFVAWAFHTHEPREARGWRGWVAFSPLIVLGCISLVPPLDPRITYFGPFHLARAESGGVSEEELLEVLKEYELLFHEEGVDTTVTVRRNNAGELALLVNGKTDASTSGDLSTQVLLGHLPSLLHPAPRSGLVIGLASGITLGALAAHPLEEVECAEISAAVVEAAELFAPYNNQVLDDPRLVLHLADGRNHLAHSGRRYDLIISEPSNPWVAGMSDLFTLEFFETCRDALEEGGLAAIWLEGYGLGPGSFRSVVGTFARVFPETSLWSTGGSDYLLVGSAAPLSVDGEVLAQRMEDEGVRADLERVGVRGPEGLLGLRITDAEGARRFAGDAPVHTDDDARLEFQTPRSLYLPGIKGAVRDAVEQVREEKIEFLARPESPETIRLAAAVERRVQARGLARRAEERLVEGRPREALDRLRMVGSEDVADPLVQAVLERVVEQAALDLRAVEGAEGAGLLRAVLGLDPGHAAAHAELGLLRLRALDCAAALGHFESSIGRAPEGLVASTGLALLLATHPAETVRDAPRSLELAASAVAIHGRTPITLRSLAAAEAALGRFPEAEVLLEEAIELAGVLGQESLLPMLDKMKSAYGKGNGWRFPCR